MREIVFHIEGGGDERTNTLFRENFRRFFQTIVATAADEKITVRFRMAGGRSTAYRAFCVALEKEADKYHALLVDSETEVETEGACWKHLQSSQDGWNCPPGVDDKQCHFMAQAMESWLCADPNALASFYEDNFNPNPIPKHTNIEKIAALELVSRLEEATKRTKKGKYHKTKHRPKLLGMLDMEKVRQRAPHCNRIFVILEAVVANTL